MQLSLNGRTCVDESIAILRAHEPAEGYYLAFSGGKDSIVLYRLAEMAGVKFDAHYNVTTIDPPELVRFIRREYPAVAWDRPPRSFFSEVEVQGLPTRLNRWCCEHLKEAGGRGRLVAVGVRAEESPARRKRGVLDDCPNVAAKVVLNPILRWKHSEVWEFIRAQSLPYCELYDQGWRRLGCVCCPYGSVAVRQRGLERWPGIFAAILRALHRRWPTRPLSWRRWRTPETMFEWWLSDERAPDDRQSRNAAPIWVTPPMLEE